MCGAAPVCEGVAGSAHSRLICCHTLSGPRFNGLHDCRYQQFKGALEKLDSKLAGNSSLPIVYQWEHQMAGPVMK